MPSLSSLRTGLRPSVFADLQANITARGPDLIGLHLGDTYLEPPQVSLLGAVVERHRDGDSLYRYGSVSGLSSFRNAIAEGLQRKGRAFAGASGDKNVLLGAGATHAIFCALSAVLAPGDDVLLLSPYWPLAHGIIVSVGARPVEVSLSATLEADSDADPYEILRAALTPATRAVYLITPNNPDGRMLTIAQLQRIAELAIEKDLWVVADEAYADLTFGARHASIAALAGMAERTLTAYSFSKSHALAGLRVGYVVAPEEVVQLATRVSTHTVFNVPLAMQHAAAAALSSGPRWTERALLLYRRSLDAVTEGLAGLPLQFSRPDGGAYVFIDFRPLLRERPLTTLLERAIGRGVLLAPGSGFGDGFERHARLCFTSEPLPRLTEGIARLAGAVRDLTTG